MTTDHTPDYIRDNFKPNDRLAVVLINKRTGSVTQRLSTAETIASPDFQNWLRRENDRRSEVYISMNALQERAQGRTKADVALIRHVFLDIDQNGDEVLQGLLQRQDLPSPHYVLSTSPGKWQVVWKVGSFEKDKAEQLQKGLARQCGADPAATDCARVLRLPGFANHKYSPPYLVRAERHTISAHPVYTPEDFPLFGQVNTSPLIGTHHPAKHRDGELTQSERDWAYTKRALARGDDPELVVAAIASYRRYDKHNPRYYAELTVRKAAQTVSPQRIGPSARGRI